MWDRTYILTTERNGLVRFVCNRDINKVKDGPTNQGLSPEAANWGKLECGKCGSLEHEGRQCMYVSSGWDGIALHPAH